MGKQGLFCVVEIFLFDALDDCLWSESVEDGLVLLYSRQ